MSLIHREAWFLPFFVRKNQPKNYFFLRGDLKQFSSKNVQIWDHLFPLLFTKDSEYLKILDIRLREVGAKRHLNGTSKVNRQTNKHTDRHTDKSTYRKHWPRGPMLWKLHILHHWYFMLSIHSSLEMRSMCKLKVISENKLTFKH